MVLNDAGVIGLSLNGKAFPSTLPIMAKVGDWVQVDYYNEGLAVHPMHLHGMPQLVIARTAIPLPAPYARRHDPGRARERYSRCSSIRPPTSSVRTTRPESGRSTATSSPTPKARTACSAW